MTNEVLAKFLGHDLTVLIQEQETLEITPVFYPQETIASEPPLLRISNG